jgi:hypothetical protein
MRIFKSILTITTAAIVVVSCIKIQQLPPEPRIEFTSFQVFDTLDILGNDCKGGRLNFYFEDGDGDLGLHPAESDESIDTTNLFLTLFRKTGGLMVEVPENDPIKPSPYRIPYIERTGQNKILKGTISVTLIYFLYDTINTDTVRYDFYIKDRAGNISNTAATSEIALSVNDLYKF